MQYQKGFVPIPILIALAISALLGILIGYQLGDGLFFSMGVGIASVIVVYKLLTKFMDNDSK